jgi:hypothetical protein
VDLLANMTYVFGHCSQYSLSVKPGVQLASDHSHFVSHTSYHSIVHHSRVSHKLLPEIMVGGSMKIAHEQPLYLNVSYQYVWPYNTLDISSAVSGREAIMASLEYRF